MNASFHVRHAAKSKYRTLMPLDEQKLVRKRINLLKACHHRLVSNRIQLLYIFINKVHHRLHIPNLRSGIAARLLLPNIRLMHLSFILRWTFTMLHSDEFDAFFVSQLFLIRYSSDVCGAATFDTFTGNVVFFYQSRLMEWMIEPQSFCCD